MKKYIFKFWPFVFITFVWLVFSSPFFLKGLVPYPSFYQSNFFAPWSAYGIYQGPVKNNAMPDIITQIYPWKEFSVSVLKNGEIPLWNPYSFSGTPHLANYQSSPFMPLNILFLLPFSFIVLWSIIVLLQPLLAGIGMYLYLRNSLNKAPSLFGAVSFMFCGFITAWMGYGTLGYAILFLPFAFFSVDQYIKTNKFIYALLTLLFIAFSLFSGHFQTSIYFLLALFAYILFTSFENRRALLFLLASFFSGILISMPQVLPSVEFYFNSVRQEIVTQLEVIPLGYFPTLFAPDIFGNPVTRNDWFGHYAEWNGFAGVLPMVLGIFAILFLIKTNRKVLFFTLLALFSLLIAFDTPVNLLIFKLNLPLFSTSASSRIIVLFSFSVAVLGAFGLDYLISKEGILRKKIITVLICALCVVFLLWVIPLSNLLSDLEKTLIARNNIIIPSAILIVFIFSLFLLAIKKFNKQALIFFPALVLVLVSADMIRFAVKWMPFEPSEFAFKELGVLSFYKDNKTNGRFLGNFTAENSVFYRVQSLGGYDPLYPKRYGEFVKFVDSGVKEDGDRSVVSFPLNSLRTKKAMDFLGVEYIPQKKSDDGKDWAFDFSSYPADAFSIVYEDDFYRIFRNLSSFPRAYVVYDFEVEIEDEKNLNRIFDEDTDLRTKVVLEEEPEFSKNPKGNSSLNINEYSPNKIRIELESDTEGILVLTDNYYEGWKAYVNGKEEKIYRTNYSFRGVVIPEGKSIVEFRYEPKSFYNGLYLAITGVVLIVLLNLYKRKYE